MKLYFVETNQVEPTKWFELYLEDMGLGIFWPTQGNMDFALSDYTCVYGIDVECEAYSEIYDALVKDWPMFAETPGQTRLRLTFACNAIMAK